MGSTARFTCLATAVALAASCVPAVEKPCSVYDEVFVYLDADGDGFGGEEALGYVCFPGAGESTNNVDCDDSNPNVNPGMDELCDLEDNDCNGLVDETHPKVPWYPDLDEDGFGGNAGVLTSCLSPGPDYTQVPGDCDDADPVKNPTAAEVCNGLDDDCDGRIDDFDPGVVPESRTSFYRDRDQDTYGDPGNEVRRCVAPGGFVTNKLDCNDRDPEINPDAKVDYCDFIDNDCDGLIDDFDIEDVDQAGQRLLPCDTDGDGYGDSAGSECLACRPTPGFGVNNDLDCDDTDPLATLPQNWLADADFDGVGAGDSVVYQCLNPNKEKPPPVPPLAPESQGIDCEPDDPTIYPGAPEACGDNVDQDCSGADCSTCKQWLDADSTLASGIYGIDTGNFNYVDIYCDMTTDGGGWTLVGSTYNATMDDASSTYYSDLTTLEPSNSHSGVFNGLRSSMSSLHDLRFACKNAVASAGFDVDLAFYKVPWYLSITTGTDANSNFSCCSGASDLDPPPARRDLIAGVNKLRGDQWNAGYLEGEDSTTDTGDFTVDFDDRGMDSNQADGTDWGEDDSTRKCGTVQNGSDQAWFIFVREYN